MAHFVYIPESTHIGTGAETIFGFDWPYLSPDDIQVTVDGVDVPTVLSGLATVLITPAPALNAAIRIYRDTDAQNPAYQFATGVPFLPRYVDENNRQTLYAVQEGYLFATDAVETANAALALATTADAKADEALTNSDNAVADAAAALLAAGNAMTAASTALTVANGVDAKADTALADSAEALALAQQAIDAVTASGVASFNGRFGFVVPAAGDYAASMIATSVSGQTVQSTLDAQRAALELAINNYADQVNAALGSNLIGYRGHTVRTELDTKLRYHTPEEYGYAIGNSLASRTAALQACHNAANTDKRSVFYSDVYVVSKLTLSDHTEYAITGTGGIAAGDAVTAYSSLLEIVNSTALKTFGSIYVSCGGNTNYTAGIKVWGSGSGPGGLRTCSLHYLGFNVIGAKVGWQWGDRAAPDNLLSENVMYGGYTYNTPISVIVIGTQAVIEANGYQLIAAGSGGLAGILHVVARCIGGVLTINGGECQIPTVSTGYCFELAPIDSPSFAHTYGSIAVNGSKIESASLLLFAHNINTIPDIAVGSGSLCISGGGGYHSFTGASFQADSTFSGKLVVDKLAHFHCNALRTAQTVAFNGPAEIDIENLAFDTNFRRGLYGITGGIPRFGYQQIFEVVNLAGQAIASGAAVTLKPQAIPSRENNQHFSANWNLATGVFTVPQGGLKDVRVFVQVDSVSARAASSVQVIINNVGVGGWFGVAGHYGAGTCELGDLPAGTTVDIRFFNADLGTVTFGSSNFDRIVLHARN
jgi:hypothetical protein